MNRAASSMLRRLLLLLVGGLSFMLHTADPAAAQSRPSRDGRRADVRETVETVERVSRQQQRAARRWASDRSLPTRLRQRDGRLVTLAGVEGRRPVYITSFNRAAAAATGTHHLRPGQRLGLNLTGRGMLLGLWDAGHALAGHQELTGRVTTGDQAPDDDHSTHVAGTLVASGVRAEAQGMAFQAALRSYDWDNDAVEMTNEAVKGMLLSNHSYGAIAGWHYGDIEGRGDQWYWFGDPTVSAQEDYLFGWYGSEAAQFDRAASVNPYYLPVIAAGNDRAESGPLTGPYRGLDARGNWVTYDGAAQPRPPDGGSDGFDTIAGAAVAKNVLTVGSIGPDDAGRPRLSSFSSLGPTDDGRIKPDLVGYGERVFSAVASGANRYGFMTGTSMATPNVTGTLLLLQQHHFNLTGRYLRAATLKALALHTAQDLGTPGPDYRYGWGLLDAEAAALQITAALANPLAVYEGALEEGTVYTHAATVDTTGPLRVTLGWTDPPGSRLSETLDLTTPQLRHDLDLRVVHVETGEVYQPYRLDPARPAAAATTGDNRVDPVEQVYLPQAVPGRYRIEISHKGAFASREPQPFALVVRGAQDGLRSVAVGHLEAEPSVDQVVLRWQTLFEHAPGTFRIERAPLTIDTQNRKQYGPSEVVGSLPTLGLSDDARAYSYTDGSVLSGRYRYRIVHEGPRAQFVAGEIEVNVIPPERFAVLSNYPNPFSDHTSMVLDLPKLQFVRLEVYDALGRRVQVLHDGVLPAGRHTLPVDASTWASGVYFARVAIEQNILTHRMVVVR